MPVSHRLIRALRRELRAHADAEKAAPMQAYMKSAMPYYGVQTPLRRAICKRLFAEMPLAGLEALQQVAGELWRTARYREERYAAIELTGYRLYSELQTMRMLPLYEEMITSGAWWDYVDQIATHRLRTLLVRYPRGMSRRMRAWSRCDDLWKRRASMICQVGRKEKTDLDLLYDCIAPNLEEPQFFLRKAIGWALRSYAWTDPAEVVRYVAEHASSLSALSRREALKNVDRTR